MDLLTLYVFRNRLSKGNKKNKTLKSKMRFSEFTRGLDLRRTKRKVNESFDKPQ